MDPKACFDILQRASQEHLRLKELGIPCCPGDAGPGPLRQLGAKAPVQAAAVAGAIAAAAGEAGGDADEEFLQCSVVETKPAAASAPSAPNGPLGLGMGAAGQTINLETGKNETVQSGMTEEDVLELFPALRAPAAATEVAQEECSSGKQQSPPPPCDLALGAIKLHEERVAVHRAYDGAFRHLLKEKGGGPKAVARTYPSVVARATARFQALSNSTRAIAAALEAAAAAEGGESLKEAASLVRRAQGLEQARLQLVAMHHIEQSQLHTRGGGNEGSCADIHRKLGSTAEEIEETISELRYCAAELREEMG